MTVGPVIASSRSRSRVARALVLTLFLVGCAEPPPPSPDVVARVADATVRWAAFEEYLETEIGIGLAAIDPPAASALLDRFVEEELLLRIAVERSLVDSSAGRREALAALVEAAAAGEITEAEVEAYYDAHPERFDRPERVRLRQLLVADRATADALRAELVAGADFAEMAREFSIDASGPSGGDQGELSAGELPEALATVVFGLEPGEVSEVVAAAYGFHIFRVEARLPAERLSLDSARAGIRRDLERQSADAAIEGLVTEARKRYNPVVYVAHLPFPYTGSLPTAE